MRPITVRAQCYASVPGRVPVKRCWTGAEMLSSYDCSGCYGPFWRGDEK
jgi:hypothetical protein